MNAFETGREAAAEVLARMIGNNHGICPHDWSQALHAVADFTDEQIEAGYNEITGK